MFDIYFWYNYEENPLPFSGKTIFWISFNSNSFISTKIDEWKKNELYRGVESAEVGKVAGI